MKTRAKPAIGLFVLLLFIFMANAMGVRADLQKSKLLSNKADTISVSAKNIDISAKKREMLELKPGNFKVVDMKTVKHKAVQTHKGPGASAMIVLVLALVIFISSRQRSI
jgi:hypothetical protein